MHPKEIPAWVKSVLYALLIALLTLSLLVALSIVWRAYFSNPPLKITSLDSQPKYALCPGDDWPISIHVRIDAPSIFFSYINVMDKDSRYNIPETYIPLGADPHPHKGDFFNYIPWTVPNIPAGDYTRVLSIRSSMDDKNPIFVVTPFQVGGDEDEFPKQSNCIR